MPNIWFTSDTHFYHDRDFLYTPRGFENFAAMNEAIVKNWNAVVKPGDTVYHLGDVLMGYYDVNILSRLNGKLNLVCGNHDTDRKLRDISAARPDTNILGTSDLIKIGKLSLFLCHYPALTANYDDKHFSQHVFSLHGHTHQKGNWLLPDNPFLYHVGMDSHNSTPVHIDEVISDIRRAWEDKGRSSPSPKDIKLP